MVELTGDVTPDVRAIAQADLIVTTPEKWDGVSRSWQNRSYVQKVAILIIDEIHLLGKSAAATLWLQLSARRRLILSAFITLDRTVSRGGQRSGVRGHRVQNQLHLLPHV